MMGSHSHNQDEHDRRSQEYYDRKAAHREEIIKPLAWVYGITAAFVAGYWIWNFFVE